MTNDLTGQRFGMLTAIAKVPKPRNSGLRLKWKCVCDCGESRDVDARDLSRGKRTSCGCAFKGKPKHLASRTRAYRIWDNMRERCTNTNNDHYETYGGRGITVCDRWMSDFRNFLEDMGQPPIGMTLDREDNDGPYCKENCRWVTRKVQARNRRTNVYYTHGHQTKTWAEWAESASVSASTLNQRVTKFGWDFERAMSSPADPRHDPKRKKASTISDRGSDFFGND